MIWCKLGKIEKLGDKDVFYISFTFEKKKFEKGGWEGQKGYG